jgi:hypothetical protein
MNTSRTAEKRVRLVGRGRDGQPSSKRWLALNGPIRILETYSLDVAAGIVGAAIFLLTFAEVGELPWRAIFCLGCAALAVYNLDHLLDARAGGQSFSPRRARHRAHRRSMAFLVGLSTLAGTLVAVSLPERILLGGLFLVVYMCAYFAGVLFGVGGMPKRLGAAIGWAAAAALPTFATVAAPLDPRLLAATVILAGTAWMNLQSYAIADGPGEGRPQDAPGPRLRSATALAVGLSLLAALGLDPAHPGPWIALASTGLLQVLLPAFPAGLVHPIGEWGFALLALVRLGR